MKKIRWGIIGVGDVTEVKSGPALYKSEHSELVAVMRRSADKAEDFAKRHNVTRWYDDADALINDPDVDVVYISTPPHVHKEYTLKVAAAGKDVYSEKPLSLTFEDCQEMISVCKDAGVNLWSAYYRRAQTRFLKIKELLDNDAIGKVHSVSTRLLKKPLVEANTDEADLPWRVLPEYSGGGIFVDMGSHTLDLLDFYLGPITEAKGLATNQLGSYPAEDTVSALFQFESGAIGSGLWDFTTDVEVDETILVGTKGTISFSSFDDSPIKLLTKQGEQEFSIPYPEHVHQPLVESIISEIHGTGRCPSTAESAARTTWVMDQVLASYRSSS